MSTGRTVHSAHPSPAYRGRGPEVVRIWLLGRFSASVGPRIVQHGEWRLRKAASLLKLLALAPEHRLHREQAMDVLWPDSGKKSASNSLRQVLFAARRVLDPASNPPDRYLILKEEQLVLCPEGDLWVDVDAFEEAAAVARHAHDPAVYQAAIDLYAGDLLPEDRYEEWTEDRREELRRLYLALLIELAGLYEERGEYGLATEALWKATANQPTLEEAHVALMRLHALCGRPEQAVAQYERLRDALYRGLGTEPGASSRRLRDEIAAGEFRSRPASPAGSPPEGLPNVGRHNLPAPRTSFVGRERETGEVKRTLAMTRLLTLTGAGGSGKTRLVLEVAKDLVGAYPDGARLVELAALPEGELVPQAVADALGVHEQPGQPLAHTLVDALRDKALLLVVDNCEHLVEAAAQLVDAILGSCPRLRVLATSREPLGIQGEVVRQVSPLSSPDTVDGESTGEPTVEGLMRYEAVRLFVDRARLRLPDFELTQENAYAVANVCRRLDGIPLAIELATARMGALAVEQVAQRLEVSLDVLKSVNRSAAPRQQTLRATLDWSHDLLSETERVLLRRLSVFAGGWTLEAAEAVCLGGEIEEEGVLDLLGGLVDKSLVLAVAVTGGTVRYRMLEPVRQYAVEKLEKSGETSEVQCRHATFFLTVAEEAEPELAGPQQRLWVERLEGEHDNLRGALSQVLERREAELGLRFGGALWRFWFAQSYLSEGIRWMERVLAMAEPAASPARVKALEGMGWLAQYLGDSEPAEAAYEEMLKLSRELGDKGNVATALNSQGMLAVARGDNKRASALLEENLTALEDLEGEGDTATVVRRFHVLGLLGLLAITQDGDYARGATLWEEGLALAREAGDGFLVGTMLSNLGFAALLQGYNERAAKLCEESLALAHELGSAGVTMVAEAWVNLGLAALGQGDHERAAASLREALAVSQEAGKKPTLINALEGMASLTGSLGGATRAARLWGAAEAAREDTSIALPPGERALHEPYLVDARSEIGQGAWEAALAQGKVMGLEEAVEYALTKEEESAPPTPLWPEKPPQDEQPQGLSPREQEVAILVARGLTNRQVSAELSISERTAGNHVAKILGKLGLRSRAQIAAWATEEKLLDPNHD